MDNTTVINLKGLPNQHGIKGYYKLRRAQLIQVLIPGFEIPRNTTRSMNTSPILDEPILDDNTPVL